MSNVCVIPLYGNPGKPGRPSIPRVVGSATIDDRDFAALSRLRWSLNSGGYASWRSGLKMHVLVMLLHGETPRFHHHVADHINRDRLDNRLENLRWVSRLHNRTNSRPRGNTSQFKGVEPRRQGHKTVYRARITVRGKDICLGHFVTEGEAAQAYDAAALLHHGEYAGLNFPR